VNYLIVVDTFFGDCPTGSARVAWDIAKLMRDRAGATITMFCSKSREDAPETSEHEGVRIVRFGRPRTLSLDPFKRRKWIRCGIEVARRHLPGKKWDLVHVHSPVQGTVARSVVGDDTRYVYTVHSPAVLEEYAKREGEGVLGKLKLLGTRELKRWEGDLLRRADRIHTLSQFTRDTIERLYGVGHKVTVIPHWCREGFHRESSREQARARLKWPQDAKILFSVRRLVQRMGLDTAIEALGPLLKQRQGAYFALAGGGPLEKPLKQLAQRLGIADRVWFLGRVDDDTLRRCYEAADCFLLPTRSLECFGLIAIEAFSYGLPVISTDTSAIPEVMNPILPECVVPAGNMLKLRDKIHQYLQGRLHLPTADALTSYVVNRFGPDVIVPKFDKLLCEWP